MMPTRALTAVTALALLAPAAAATGEPDVLFDLTDEQYYAMPPLFELDDWAACGATGGAYCVGSFELSPELTQEKHQLYDMMKRYSANWVDNFNHTRLHRGYCLHRHCAQHAPATLVPHLPHIDVLHTWFSICVNATTKEAYNLSARLYKLEYCQSGPPASAPLTASQIAFAAFVATLLAFAVVSTVLEATLPNHKRKGAVWALSWSLQGSWRTLHATPPSEGSTDLRCFEGLRVLILAVVVIMHDTFIDVNTYLSDTKTFEQMRRSMDTVLLVSSCLLVQIYFIMSSFLLAHKMLQQRKRGDNMSPLSTFANTMINRIIRVSPSYFVVVWFAASWWERLGAGPLWEPLVHAEAAICRHKWWTHLIFLHNILYVDDKCLIQTWYLAADMQLYALCLVLTLALWRWRRAALCVLLALLAASVALQFGLAYHWRLVPTLILHRPESGRVVYRDDPSFNVLYQSPLANVPGALAGLLLAHIHHALLDNNVQIHRHKLFSWLSVLAVPMAAWWMGGSPLLMGRGPPDRLAAAALAAIERPVFVFFVGLALLGAINGVESVTRRVLSWAGWSCWARLSYSALLLHMPIHKALVASRLLPSQLDRPTLMMEWFGVMVLSHLAAVPLTLLVELPAARLHRALRPEGPRPAPNNTRTKQNFSEPRSVRRDYRHRD